jgi:microcystin-dependent protein
MGLSSALGAPVGAIPAGSVIPYAGSTAPAGWLLCFGQNVSRTDYGALFAAIGTTYGSGDGSTTFALPDLRGRVIAGVDNMGGSAASRLTSTTITGGGDAPGEVGGAQTHTLSSAEMPSHTHTQDAHTHTQVAHNHTQVAHSHYVQENSSNGTRMGGHYTAGSGSVAVSSIAGSAIYGDGSAAITESATPTINNTTATNNNTTATNQNTGGGGAHNNVQPTMVMNYIIKAVAL